jgi:hypothetical protein
MSISGVMQFGAELDICLLLQLNVLAGDNGPVVLASCCLATAVVCDCNSDARNGSSTSDISMYSCTQRCVTARCCQLGWFRLAKVFHSSRLLLARNIPQQQNLQHIDVKTCDPSLDDHWNTSSASWACCSAVLAPLGFAQVQHLVLGPEFFYEAGK